MQAPLGGKLVVDLTRYLPGAFASRELLRLGARVVRVEQPDGDPMRRTAPAWHDELNAGKDSLVADLPAEAPFVRALLARADVVLESFRPGVAARLGVGPDDAPASCVYCSITGFGLGNRHERRAGHDLNYLGWAGVLERTAPGAGGGGRLTVSMTHRSYPLAARTPILTDGFACYSIYACADGRMLTVAALEPRFFAHLCELLGRPELAARQFDGDQSSLRAELAAAFAQRSLADWLAVVDAEDVCVGPVSTRAEAAEFAPEPLGEPPQLGAHTTAWRRELGL
jgi:alpha-methylacyl-CoA racemase